MAPTTDTPTFLIALDARLELLNLALAGFAEFENCEISLGIVNLMDELRSSVQDEIERHAEISAFTDRAAERIANSFRRNSLDRRA